MKAITGLSNFAQKYFALLIVIFVVVAYFVPQYFAWFGAYLTLLLGIVMFGMGLTLKLTDFKLVFVKPVPVLAGVAAQYLVMPFAAFGLAYLFQLPPELAAGLVLLGCVPGGTASNVMTYIAKGDVPLSICMTSISTVLAPIMTPLLLLLLAGQWMPVDPFAMFKSIFQVIIIPIALGLIVKRLFPKAVEKSLAALPLVSITAILIIGAAVVAANAGNIAVVTFPLVASIMLHNFIGLGLGYSIGKLLKLDTRKKRAVALEVGMQNSALSVQLATVHLNPLAAIPGVGGAIWHQISGPLIASYWSRKKVADIQEDIIAEPEKVG
ncbi:bile acid:sodium symporter family protein [Ornithinibacillus californiensis]|uniref:bile acid:sodium symporter family protein n=1 Tax=Ornithinibacillus californiensis TaxID=161536 RepID=UPI00064D936F|nr:bile acid:sodium symporter family protein [Ornithinibacillus californiensis]